MNGKTLIYREVREHIFATADGLPALFGTRLNTYENSPARAYPRAKARGFTALAYFGKFSGQKFSTLKGGAYTLLNFCYENKAIFEPPSATVKITGTNLSP